MGKEHDVIGWAGGGNWSNYPDDTSVVIDPPPAPAPVKPVPAHDPREVARRFGEEAPPGKQHGFICGRFSPPHKGHEYLIEIGRQSCHRFVVLVFAGPGDGVPVATRVRWLKEMFPGVEVRDGGPRPDPKEKHFAERWRKLIETHVPETPRYMFTSEPDAGPIASAAGATAVIIDPGRNAIPSSSTAIREDPLRNFELLAAQVRPYVVRRVSVVGAPETGKTTLAMRLAWDHYGTLFVPEEARTFAERRGGALEAKDLQLVARTQIGCEDALARHARQLLFCDTDLISLRARCERLNDGMCPQWIIDEIPRRPYDLVLLNAPNPDAPADRHAAHARLEELLEEQRATVVTLVGGWDDRLDGARNAVDQLMKGTQLLSARGRIMAA